MPVPSRNCSRQRRIVDGPALRSAGKASFRWNTRAFFAPCSLRRADDQRSRPLGWQKRGAWAAAGAYQPQLQIILIFLFFVRENSTALLLGDGNRGLFLTPVMRRFRSLRRLVRFALTCAFSLQLEVQSSAGRRAAIPPTALKSSKRHLQARLSVRR